MLKQLVNEARIDFRIRTTGPLLIKSGQPSHGLTDMEPVMTMGPDGHVVPYIPGSSLKGVFRSQSERILRTLGAPCCNPFETHAGANEFCGKRLERQATLEQRKMLPMEESYAGACAACRLFGCTQFIGRFSVDDGRLLGAHLIESRDNVAINRITGGSTGRALFSLDAVAPGAEFGSRIQVRNFEIWQLGLVLVTLQDMVDGLVRLGMGRSRGLGSVEAVIDTVAITEFGLQAPPEHQLRGLGAAVAGGYGTSARDLLEADWLPAAKARSLRWERVLDEATRLQLTDAALEHLGRAVEHWPGVQH